MGPLVAAAFIFRYTRIPYKSMSAFHDQVDRLLVFLEFARERPFPGPMTMVLSSVIRGEPKTAESTLPSFDAVLSVPSLGDLLK